jgi:hypothetical protein
MSRWTDRREETDMAESDNRGNEGEGSRTAAHEYEQGVKEHLRRGNVEEEAERAARDLDAHPDELRKAEEEGKRRSAGDLEADLEKE